jgi:hypothetical protein
MLSRVETRHVPRRTPGLGRFPATATVWIRESDLVRLRKFARASGMTRAAAIKLAIDRVERELSRTRAPDA